MPRHVYFDMSLLPAADFLDFSSIPDQLHNLAGQHAAADGGGELGVHILLQLLDGQAVLTGDDGNGFRIMFFMLKRKPAGAGRK